MFGKLNTIAIVRDVLVDLLKLTGFFIRLVVINFARAYKSVKYTS